MGNETVQLELRIAEALKKVMLGCFIVLTKVTQRGYMTTCSVLIMIKLIMIKSKSGYCGLQHLVGIRTFYSGGYFRNNVLIKLWNFNSLPISSPNV